MKKIIIVLALLFFTPLAANAGNCGLQPLPPLGCADPQCVCDANGNCHWIFSCN